MLGLLRKLETAMRLRLVDWASGIWKYQSWRFRDHHGWELGEQDRVCQELGRRILAMWLKDQTSLIERSTPCYCTVLDIIWTHFLTITHCTVVSSESQDHDGIATDRQHITAITVEFMSQFCVPRAKTLSLQPRTYCSYSHQRSLPLVT